MQARTIVKGFFDGSTSTVSYVIFDRRTRRAAIVDPVLDFDLKSGQTSTVQADRLLTYLREKALDVQWILETHAHADHLSAARYLREKTGARVAIGENIRDVQAAFKKLYNLDRDFVPDGRHFDHLFRDGEVFRIGDVEATALLVAGHTPADMAYLVDGAVFVGDTLFMPDVGTARADFPGGNARALYRSIRRILDLPLDTRIYVCHDYPPKGREPAWETTVAEERARNIHVHDGVGEDEFVALRQARDATLEVPALILPSLQINIRAGQLPSQEGNGISYLKIPLNALGKSKPHDETRLEA